MFTIEEKTIIKMYSGFIPDKERTLTSLRENLPYIEEEEIKNTVSEIIKKITSISNEEFNKLDLKNTLDNFIPTESN